MSAALGVVQVWVSAPRLHAALRAVRHAWRPVDEGTWRSTLQVRSRLLCLVLQPPLGVWDCCGGVVLGASSC